MVKVAILAQQELGKLKRNRLFIAGLITVVAVIILNQGLFAAAQTLEDSFNSATNSACEVINLARSTLTWVILVGAIVVGGIMRQAGSQYGMPIITGAIVGTFIVIGAAGIATVIFVDAGDCVEDVGTAG